MNLKPVEQQVVVVVGATSGIGRAAAFLFAERGAKVLAAGRSQPALDSLVSEIRKMGGIASAELVDVTNFEQVQRLAGRAVELYGRIDSWVHLAAVSLYGTFEDTPLPDFRRLLDVNLMGQVHGAKAALPHLKRGGGGALIHVTSVEAKHSMPYQSAYAASKHAIEGFLEALRVELKHEGANISVTNVLPAAINTPFFAKAATYLGVKPRPYPPVYQASLAAEAILVAAEKPVREIYVGGAGRLLIAVQSVAPRLVDRFFEATGFRMQRTDEPKPPSAPNNLYEHLPGYDQVEGEYGVGLMSAFSSFWQAIPLARWLAAGSVMAASAWLAARTWQRSRPAG